MKTLSILIDSNVDFKYKLQEGEELKVTIAESGVTQVDLIIKEDKLSVEEQKSLTLKDIYRMQERANEKSSS